jgi:hypothetical protein
MNQGQIIGINLTIDDLYALIVNAIQSVKAQESSFGSGKRLLSPKEVEREYGISLKILERWRATGVGPAYTNMGGRNIYYERTVLDAFLETMRVKTTGGTRFDAF